MLAARELYSLNCSLLAARKANILSLLVLAKKSQCSHARECSQRPFVTPIFQLIAGLSICFSASSKNSYGPPLKLPLILY